jgi:hypothetical protein
LEQYKKALILFRALDCRVEHDGASGSLALIFDTEEPAAVAVQLTPTALLALEAVLEAAKGMPGHRRVFQ